MTYLRTLMDAAALQRGFVTPENARDLGVPPVELPKLAARGAYSIVHTVCTGSPGTPRKRGTSW